MDAEEAIVMTTILSLKLGKAVKPNLSKSFDRDQKTLNSLVSLTSYSGLIDFERAFLRKSGADFSPPPCLRRSSGMSPYTQIG